MATKDKWTRVSRKHPCPICEKADWCTISSDGKYACCMRLHLGSIRRLKNDGYLFALDASRPAPPQKKERPAPVINFHALVRSSEARLTDAICSTEAFYLGLPPWTLRGLHCGIYELHTLGFPMVNANGQYIGVRLRSHLDGSKWCVTGSHNGLFVTDQQLPDEQHIFVVEGGTNVAALLSIGLLSVGRPSNVGGREMLCEYLKPIKRRVVIVKDNDTKPLAVEATTRGAWQLALNLIALKKSVKIITLPVKDARDYVRAGAGIEAFMCLIHSARTLDKARCEEVTSNLCCTGA